MGKEPSEIFDSIEGSADNLSIDSSDMQSESEEETAVKNNEDVSMSKEITSMQLIWEDDYILMACTDSKNLYVYDEENTEESTLLRTITGAHKTEISIVKYNYWLSLIALGSLDGEITVWDFEMSRLESYCFGHHAEVTGIEFLDPNPLMVTSSMDSTICIWGVRPCPFA